MSLWRFDITLTLRAPILSEAQGGKRFGLDSAVLRDWNGIPAISGTLVRGNLLHAWRELNTYGLNVEIDKWMGIAATTGNQPSRSGLIFSHWFSAPRDGSANSARHRIKIEEQTGNVEQGALQVIEEPYVTGEKVEFLGHAWAELADENSAVQLAGVIRKGLAWVPALGALKGAGFGKVESVEVKPVEPVDNKKLTIHGDQFGIALSFDRPICFSRPKIGKSEGNRFEAEEFVPGAAIIAALAARWPKGKESQLEKLHITHALPTEDDSKQRPLAIPCSLAMNHESKPYDMALRADPLLDGAAPAFQPDWKGKHWATAATLCGWPSLDRILETHTAIEAGSNSAAGGQLFSIDCIDTRNQVWLANVDLAGFDDSVDRENVRATLASLLSNGLWPLGKTDARAQVAVSAPHDFAVPVGAADSIVDKVILLFATAAEVLAPIPSAGRIANPGDWLAEYSRVIEKVSNSTLKVKRILTREKLVGGNYLHKRFGNGQDYKPRLLTEAGSILVLEIINPEKASSYLADWLTHGFPSPAGEDWRTNPYRRQNGYGEIVINPIISAGVPA